LVYGVRDNIDAPKTAVQVWTQNSPPTDNQLWTFEQAEGAPPGFYIIKSLLGSNLVLEVYVDPITGKQLLQINTQDPPPSPKQLWKFVPFFSLDPIAQGFIQSLLDTTKVVDLPSPTGIQNDKKGEQLQIWRENRPAQSGNQNWFPLAQRGNSYHAATSLPVPLAGGVRITGTGLQPGTPVYGNYGYIRAPAAGGGSDSGPVFAVTDFGGNFESDLPTSLLKEGVPGTLQLTIWFSEPGFSGPLAWNWNGSAFTP
jgi:hypothetical protein